MKNLKNTGWFLCILLLLYACSNDEKGQYPVHGGAPANVSNARVEENFSGGALIVYDLPREDDALYVRARYTLDDGTAMELKSSVFIDRITIVGIGRSREVPVILTVVDRSQNESEPVTVMAHPYDSPIYEISKTMIVQADFGGIGLSWDNPEKYSIVIDILTPDAKIGMAQIERFYSSAPTGRANLRGQESVETVFSVVVRDRWGNSSDPVSGTFTPLYEEKLDKSLFKAWSTEDLPMGSCNATYGWNGWEIENLWDEIWGAVSDNGYACANGPDVCWDMGQVVQISRFKIYSRDEQTLCYNHAMMKRFQLWGSPTPDVNADFSGWQFIGEFESIKPSGLPLGVLTSEDVQHAAFDGEDYEVLMCPPVRYMRIYCLETWGGMGSPSFREFTFWGQVQ